MSPKLLLKPSLTQSQLSLNSPPGFISVLAAGTPPAGLAAIGFLLALSPLGVGDQMTILFVAAAGVFGLLQALWLHWWIARTPFIWLRIPAPRHEEPSQLPVAA
jgi:hypothetical protein